MHEITKVNYGEICENYIVELQQQVKRIKKTQKSLHNYILTREINDIIIYFYNLLFISVEESYETVDMMMTNLYYELIDNVLGEFDNRFSELNCDIINSVIKTCRYSCHDS